MEIWDLWFPGAAATGLAFARARIERAEKVWVHSPPQSLSVHVRDEEGGTVCKAELKREGRYLPMALLQRAGESMTREDRFPLPDDAGTIAIMPGGDAGVLKQWWNAPDGSEWRWQVEFYNHT